MARLFRDDFHLKVLSSYMTMIAWSSYIQIEVQRSAGKARQSRVDFDIEQMIEKPKKYTHNKHKPVM